MNWMRHDCLGVYCVWHLTDLLIKQKIGNSFSFFKSIYTDVSIYYEHLPNKGLFIYVFTKHLLSNQLFRTWTVLARILIANFRTAISNVVKGKEFGVQVKHIHFSETILQQLFYFLAEGYHWHLRRPLSQHQV